MQNLYNQLTNPIPEYQADGVIKYNPPTSVMLRSARVIKQLANINDNNLLTINRLQVREGSLLSDLERLNNEIKTLRDTISELTSIRGTPMPLSPQTTNSEGI